MRALLRDAAHFFAAACASDAFSACLFAADFRFALFSHAADDDQADAFFARLPPFSIFYAHDSAFSCHFLMLSIFAIG